VNVPYACMQVNRSPSFGTDEQLDYDIKSAVIEDAVRMLNIKYAITVIIGVHCLAISDSLLTL